MKALEDASTIYFSEIKSHPFPKCFENSKKYEAWLEAESNCHTEPRMFPCRDCRIEFQQKMKSENRCHIAEVGNVHMIMKQRN